MGGGVGQRGDKRYFKLINWIHSRRLQQKAPSKRLIGGGVRKGKVHNSGFSVLNKFFPCFRDSYQIVFET